MSYIPPAAGAVNFDAVDAYTPPAGNAVNFVASAASAELRMTAVTENAVLSASLLFAPAIQVTMNAVTENATAGFVLHYAPAIVVAFNAVTADAMADFVFQHTPIYSLSLAAATADSVAVFVFHHTPRYALALAATTADALADFVLRHIPPVYLSMDATTDPATANFVLDYKPRFTLSMDATTADATLAGALFHSWTIAVNPYRDAKVFQLRLEKTGLDPLLLPFTNVSVRAAIEGRQSSITATIPDLDAIDAIAARSSDGLLVFAGGYIVNGGRRLNTILTLPLTDIRPDEGTTNKSLTLTAKGPSPPAASKQVTAGAIEYQSINGLKRLIRTPVNVNLLPGDIVVTAAASWSVGEIVYALGEGGESMTVTEA